MQESPHGIPSGRCCRPSGLQALALVLLGVWPHLPGVAEELEISVSPTPVGSGARAAGMGNAFVAIADDATAASWNPAGLVQLERPELSLAYRWNGISEEFSAYDHPEMSGTQRAQNLDINYLSVVYPLPGLVLNRNVALALNYQRKYELSRSFSIDYRHAAVTRGGTVANTTLAFDFDQEGSLGAITPALAFEVTQRITLGVSVNLWEKTFFNENGWKQTSVQQGFSLTGGVPAYLHDRTEERYENFSGTNLTLGALWSLNDKWRLGLRYDTAFSGKADYSRDQLTIRMNPGTVLTPFSMTVLPGRNRGKREVRFPASLALGAAYQHSDRLTVAFDVTRTDWNEFYVKLPNGTRQSLVDASSLDNPLKRTHFQPAYAIRLGGEYVFLPQTPKEELNRLWTMRAGVFMDEEPATDKSGKFKIPSDIGSGRPDQFFGFGIGLGVQLNNRVNLDAAYQLRFGHGVNKDFVRGVRGFEEDVFQHLFMVSTVVYF